MYCEPLTEATDCPSSSAAEGQPCLVEHSLCKLPSEGTACICTTCTWFDGVFLASCPAGKPRWQCLTHDPWVPLAPPCPALEPTLGTTCTTPVSCTYFCGVGARKVCRDGVWVGEDGGFCPV
jgi:hypothetical protein